jgi:hyperosmotically inducible protein
MQSGSAPHGAFSRRFNGKLSVGIVLRAAAWLADILGTRDSIKSKQFESNSNFMWEKFMNRNNWPLAGVIATMMLFVAACASTPTERSTGQAVDDTTLLTKVKSELIASPATDAHDIDVEVYKGQVQLNGFVESESQKTSAGKVTQQVSGVKSVRNNLQVKANRSSGEVVDDTLITTKVKAALIGDARTKAYQIEVTTNKGRVELGGFVDTSNAKTAATEVATAVAGVKSVSNGLTVKG